MNREEVARAARQQAAAMLSAYHDALNTMLGELVELVPQHRRGPFRSAVQGFTVKVLAMLASWSRP